jgi:chromosome partitioning protein
VFRIAVLNSKGGAGKTTLAVNLAAWLTARGHRAAIVDYDPQGSALAWLARRPATAPRILGVKASDIDFRNSRAYRLVDGHDVTHLILDTPAAIAPQNLIYFTRDAHRILMPVLPSAIDTHAAARMVQNLLLQAGLRREPERLGIVASRTRQGAVAYRTLQRFLQAMDLQIVATVRDSQNYVKSAEAGLGIAEMPAKLAGPDLATWDSLGEWLRAAEEQVRAQEARPVAAVVSPLRPVPASQPPPAAAPAPAPGSPVAPLPPFLRPKP